MKLTNRIIPAGLIGQEEYYILSGKPTDDPNVSVYLLNVLDPDPKPLNVSDPDNYSLWNVETLNENEFRLWPYKGADYKELIIELGKDFIENAFS